MDNRKKTGLRKVPTYLVSGVLFIGAVLKIAGVHPMAPHFAEMGLQPYLPLLGGVELICVLLFLFPKTVRLGLLLLTGYLGGAMAAEFPYHMMAAPAVVLVLVWTAAFIRMRGLFLGNNEASFTTAKA